MDKGIKIFLSVLALVSIGFSLAFYFGWGPFAKKETGQKPTPTPIQESAQTNKTSGNEDLSPELKEISLANKESLISPVDKKYFEEALLDQESPQVLSFFLDAGTSIKAIFPKGKVIAVAHNQKPFPNNNPFEEIQLQREDGQFWASYVIYGTVLVSKGDIIEGGQQIAIAKEGGLGFRGGTNLSLWIHNKNNDFMKLSKEMFTQ